MKALILAAGRGTRLQHLTRGRPKCLVDINGRCLIDYQLDALSSAGVTDICVVTGYRSRDVRDYLRGRVDVLINERYAETNSLYSMWLARHAFTIEEFILLNGDIIIDCDLMGRLVRTPGCASLVDTDKPLRDGEMNVVIRDGRIVRFSKDVPAAEAHAESVQITKFDTVAAPLLFARAGELIESGELTQFPAAAYTPLLERRLMQPVGTGGAPCFEIDTVADYETCCRDLAAGRGTHRE
ncbi:MAG: phosphocholine cytidylyltransferase family protein [Candidatus Omnitrophica bacterium]|nr:phosphocholine cytidylyltransferase family protein [Candidatus Omnitrophota bacterium]MCB9720108.1 phosphocholine cytidylyltransferase family protein [Candidatus Omnitrophota bacterium]